MALHPDGETVAAAGVDGVVRLIDVASGNVTAEFSPAPVAVAVAAAEPKEVPRRTSSATSIRCCRGWAATRGPATGPKGKNGFKLSLRGYDPIFDVRALTDDHAAAASTSPRPTTA